MGLRNAARDLAIPKTLLKGFSKQRLVRVRDYRAAYAIYCFEKQVSFVKRLSI
jgi:hypothetical protein